MKLLNTTLPFERHIRTLAGPLAAWFISLWTVVIGAVLSIWPQDVWQSISAAWKSPFGSPDWPIIIFCGFTVVWVWLLYRHLRATELQNQERDERLIAAVLHAPNPNFLSEYSQLYHHIAQELERPINTLISPAEQCRLLEEALRNALTALAQMTKLFSNAPTHACYGANIMLIAKPDPAKPGLFDTEVWNALRFYDKQSGNPSSLRAILFLPEELLVRSHDGRTKRNVPLISLPVPDQTEDSAGYKLALPGAPWALLTGSLSLYGDTKMMVEEDCADFAAPIREELKSYFAKQGDGHSVRSFLSYRIGTEQTPVGVLNIDSDQANLLGPVTYYYSTFIALLSPILHLLSKSLEKYYELLRMQEQSAIVNPKEV